MSNLYISIVSHNNDEDIISNSNLRDVSLISNVNVIIRDNVSSHRLEKYCKENSFYYFSSKRKLGFGTNNNKNFESALKLGMTQDDWFVLINPDVDITPSMVNKLWKDVSDKEGLLFAINLFSDDRFSVMEESLRRYPTFLSFLNIIKGGGFTEPYKKSELENYAEVDWGAGSFLIFKAHLFERLKGFDEKYFMYFEDVDICYRAKNSFGARVVFLKNIHATHKGGYQNRKIMSQHFRWYISSLVRFLVKSRFRGVS